MNDPSLIERDFTPRATPPPSQRNTDPADLAEAVRHLSASRADDYEQWVETGMAIKAAGGSLNLFDEFSRKSAKYKEGEPGAKWATFNGNGVSAGSIFHWAEQAGYRPNRNGKIRKPTTDKPAATATPAATQGNDDPCADLIVVDAIALQDQYPKLRAEVIGDFLREQEIGCIVGPSKAAKTFMLILLALCKVTGRMWLNRFAMTAGKVLFIDLELHPETLARRIHSVAAALGITSGEYAERFDLLPLRGRLRDLNQMDSLFRRIDRGKYPLIILDPLFRCYPPQTNENDNAHMATIFNTIDRYTEMTGSSFIISHHSSKGSQSQKDMRDVGAGAGSWTRSVDSLLVMRPHREENASSVELITRSFSPSDAFATRWKHPIHYLDENLNPDDLREPGQRAASAKTMTPEEFAATFLNGKPLPRNLILAKASGRVGVNESQRLFSLAQAEGFIEPQADPKDRRKVLYAKVQNVE